MAWDAEFQASTTLVLLALCDCADDSGLCYPSIAHLVRKCKLSERTVQRAITELEMAGVLERQFQFGRSNDFFLHEHKLRELLRPRTPTKVDRAHPRHGDTLPPVMVTPSPVMVTPHPRHGDTHNHHRTVREPIPDPYTPEFEQAWGVYPKQGGHSKQKAFKAWNARLREGTTAEQMMAGVKGYANHLADKKTEQRFMMHAATFFGPDKHFETDWAAGAEGAATDEPWWRK